MEAVATARYAAMDAAPHLTLTLTLSPSPPPSPRWPTARRAAWTPRLDAELYIALEAFRRLRRRSVRQRSGAPSPSHALSHAPAPSCRCCS